MRSDLPCPHKGNRECAFAVLCILRHHSAELDSQVSLPGAHLYPHCYSKVLILLTFQKDIPSNARASLCPHSPNVWSICLLQLGHPLLSLPLNAQLTAKVKSSARDSAQVVRGSHTVQFLLADIYYCLTKTSWSGVLGCCQCIVSSCVSVI